MGLKNIDISRNSRWKNQMYRQRVLEEKIKKNRPSILIVMRGEGFSEDFLTYIKKKYSVEKVIGWWVKCPKWVDLMERESVWYDDYYFSIHNDFKNNEIRQFKAVGVDETIYRKL